MCETGTRPRGRSARAVGPDQLLAACSDSRCAVDAAGRSLRGVQLGDGPPARTPPRSPRRARGSPARRPRAGGVGRPGARGSSQAPRPPRSAPSVPSGVPSRRTRPSSTSMRSISSTKSGLPWAAAVIRPRTSSDRSACSSRLSIRSLLSLSASGWSVSESTRSEPRPSSSAAARAARAVQVPRSGRSAPSVLNPARYSIRSRNVGSAPVDVVEQNDQGTFRRQRPLEQLSDRPEHLSGWAGAADSPSARRRTPSTTSAASSCCGDRASIRLRTSIGRVIVADPGRLPDDLGDRPERDPLTVGKATAFDDPRPAAHPRDELMRQARLAETGRAEDRQELTAALQLGSLNASSSRRSSSCRPTSGESRRRATMPGLPALTSSSRQAGTGSRFALQRQRPRTSSAMTASRTSAIASRLAEQDLARRSAACSAAGRAEAGAAFNAGAARCAGCGDVAHRGPHVPLPSERAAAPDRSLQL